MTQGIPPGKPSRDPLPPGKHTLFKYIFTKNNVFGIQTFFNGFNMFLSFLAENDTERSWNHLKKQVLEPQDAVMVKNSETVVNFVAGL